MKTRARNAIPTVDPRSQAIATTLRAQEIQRARRQEKQTRAAAKHKEQLRRKARRRARSRSGARVEIVERSTERELIFHGPHTSADLWILTIAFACFLVPTLIAAIYFMPLLGVLLALALATTWLVVVYTSVRVTVTKLGYFEARRWNRFVGRQSKLGLEVRSGRGDDRYTFECLIKWGDHCLWTMPRLSRQDAAAVRRFEAKIATEPQNPPHEGAYREAA